MGQESFFLGDIILDKKYAKMIGLKAEKINEDIAKQNKINKAFDFANNCRDKEIDRFWTRGLYFWGFIAASFGTYMAVLNASLKIADSGERVRLSFSALLEMSFMSKAILAVIAYICFVFCFSWLAIHKGSKYWQENWETHLDYLEDDVIGKIYWTYIDPRNNCKFKKSPISTQAYDFSVSKISLLCSLLLSFCSFLLFMFHCILLFLKEDIVNSIFNKEFCITLTFKSVIIFLILFAAIIFLIFFWISADGNAHKNTYDNSYNYFCQNVKTFKIRKNQH